MITLILSMSFFGTGGWFLGYIFPSSTMDSIGPLRSNITFSVLGAVFGLFIGFILAQRLFRSVSHCYTTMGRNYLSPICTPIPNEKDIYLVRNSNGNIEYSYGGGLQWVEKKDILSVTVKKGDAPYFEIRPIKWIGWDLFTVEPMSERSPVSFVISEEAMILNGKVEVETTRQVKIVSS